MATPSLEIPAEWKNEIDKLSRWYGSDERYSVAHVQSPPSTDDGSWLALVLHIIGMRASGDNGILSRYLVGSLQKEEVSKSEWDSAGYSVGMRPVVSRYGGIGFVSDFNCRYKLIIIDADHSKSVDYAISLVKLSILAKNEQTTILRFVWLSSAPVDKDLGRMLAVATNRSETPVTAFRLTQRSNSSNLSNLRWIQYKASDGEYPDAVMEAIAPAYAMVQDPGPSEYKITRTIAFWDGDSEWKRHHLRRTLLAAARKYFANEKDTRSIYITPGLMGRSLNDAKNSYHLIILNSEVKEVFDTETSHVVQKWVAMSRAKMLTQITCALDKDVEQADRTIHAQVALQDILDAEPKREFEDIHLPVFIIYVMDECPEITIDRLRVCFVIKEPAFAEAIRRLYMLGLIYYGMDGVSVHLNISQARRTLDFLSTTGNDLSVACFLSCITEDTPATARSAMIDIAAIVLTCHALNPFFVISPDHFADEDSINGLLQRHCIDVPSDVIKSGAMWLALAIFRQYEEEWHTDKGFIKFEDGTLTLSSNTCRKISSRARRIDHRVNNLIPEAQDNASEAMLRISHEDVREIQRCMVRAWAHNVLLPDGRGGLDSIFSGTSIKLDPDQGLRLPQDALLHVLSFGFALYETEYYAWLPTVIPEQILFDTVGEMGCDLVDFATVYFEEDDEDY
ncbi:hypothetical protein CCUS01_09721 [Colletotrichum cuscutae]|uniref:Uncharacterized protein n=1 Tax=Colletotrichum cuscutae TaxID=1209917 RepID=A0AAI9XS51_9PEZI|nr:hypothetical protein CCUS01_09721 [Colletotrichum cuscutae]